MDRTLFKHRAMCSYSLLLTSTLLPAGGDAVMNVVKVGFQGSSQKGFLHIRPRQVFQLQTFALEPDSFLLLTPPGSSFNC